MAGKAIIFFSSLDFVAQRLTFRWGHLPPSPAPPPLTTPMGIRHSREDLKVSPVRRDCLIRLASFISFCYRVIFNEYFQQLKFHNDSCDCVGCNYHQRPIRVIRYCNIKSQVHTQCIRNNFSYLSHVKRM